MRYLGIDFGSKKVGLALSDEVGTLGFPYAVVAVSPKLVEEVCVLIAKEDVGAVVIGDSRTLRGEKNPIASKAEAFGTLLTERSGTPVFYESEVFTTSEARRSPHKVGKSRSPKKTKAVDASAAALILSSYLSRTHHE